MVRPLFFSFLPELVEERKFLIGCDMKLVKKTPRNLARHVNIAPYTPLCSSMTDRHGHSLTPMHKSTSPDPLLVLFGGTLDPLKNNMMIYNTGKNATSHHSYRAMVLYK